jgi:hypothetical protein
MDKQRKPIIYISLDLELTGLDMKQHDICQIGAWATDTEGNYKGYFVSDVGFEYPLADPHCLKVCRQNKQRNLEAPDAYIVWKNFLTFLRRWKSYEIVFIGFGIESDLDWLEYFLQHEGLCLPPSDTVEISEIRHMKGLPFAGLGKSLKEAYKKQGDAHDALSDAMQASLVFHELFGKK